MRDIPAAPGTRVQLVEHRRRGGACSRRMRRIGPACSTCAQSSGLLCSAAALLVFTAVLCLIRYFDRSNAIPVRIYPAARASGIDIPDGTTRKKARPSSRRATMPMGGDISNSTTLDRVLKTRASDSGEIIAALTDATRLKFAVNLLLNMEELDLHHHLVLTSSQVTCDALWRRTHRLSQLSVGCAYSSFLRRSDGHGGGDDGGGGDGSGGSAGGSNRLAGYSGTISTSTRQRRIEMGLDAYGFTDDHVYHLWCFDGTFSQGPWELGTAACSWTPTCLSAPTRTRSCMMCSPSMRSSAASETIRSAGLWPSQTPTSASCTPEALSGGGHTGWSPRWRAGSSCCSVASCWAGHGDVGSRSECCGIRRSSRTSWRPRR